jgi:hypothetical protein
VNGTQFLIDQNHNLTKCCFNNTVVDVFQWISPTAIVCKTPPWVGPATVAFSIQYNGVIYMPSVDFNYYSTLMNIQNLTIYKVAKALIVQAVLLLHSQGVGGV